MAGNDLAAAILATSNRIGASPRDLAAAMSYETGGTYDSWKAGPTTQWGQHRGLIQMGEPQRAKYGVYQGMPVAAQVEAAGNYLQDAGFKPGMQMLDLYSAINAGRVGRYNASDANNGGAPGTVADKVNNQMAGHFANADKLLGGTMQPAAPPPAGPAGQAPQAGTTLAAALPGATLPGGAATLPVAAALNSVPVVDPAIQQDREAGAARDQARRKALFSGGKPGLAAMFV